MRPLKTSVAYLEVEEPKRAPRPGESLGGVLPQLWFVVLGGVWGAGLASALTLAGTRPAGCLGAITSQLGGIDGIARANALAGTLYGMVFGLGLFFGFARERLFRRESAWPLALLLVVPTGAMLARALLDRYLGHAFGAPWGVEIGPIGLFWAWMIAFFAFGLGWVLPDSLEINNRLPDGNLSVFGSGADAQAEGYWMAVHLFIILMMLTGFGLVILF